MRPILFSLAALALVLSSCATPDAEQTARVCIRDSGFCYFPDDPNAPTDPYGHQASAAWLY